MPKTLVLYFSVTGHTETLARAIGEKVGADVEAIRPRSSYAGAFGAVRGIWQHITGRSPELLATRDPSPYELVIVGTPVWGGRICAPVRSYLRLRGGSIRRLAGFWISASGQDYATVGRQMERLTGQALVAATAFADPEVKSGKFAEHVRAFAAQVANAPLSKPSPATPAAEVSRRGPVAVH